MLKLVNMEMLLFVWFKDLLLQNFIIFGIENYTKAQEDSQSLIVKYKTGRFDFFFKHSFQGCEYHFCVPLSLPENTKMNKKMHLKKKPL